MRSRLVADEWTGGEMVPSVLCESSEGCVCDHGLNQVLILDLGLFCHHGWCT